MSQCVVERVVEEVSRSLLEKYGVLDTWECGGRRQGFMVVFEGLDGSGVSTHSAILASVLRRVVVNGEYRVVYSKEPTRGPLGFILWQVLEGYLPGLRRPEILALLFAADRFWHLYMHEATSVAKGLVGAMDTGHLVVLDRYKYSSIAYQSAPLPGSPGAPVEWLFQVNSLAPPPHLVVYLDVDPRTASERIVTGRDRLHLYESRDRLAVVRENYRRILSRLHLYENGAWKHLVPRSDCLYPAQRKWPLVLVVEEDGRGLEETAWEVVGRTVSLLLGEGLLSRPEG